MQDFAATHTQGPGNGTTNVAANEDSIYVHGIVLSNTSANTATITFNTTESTVSPIMILEMSGRETNVIDIGFLADKGLQWVGSGNNPEDIQITVFHSNVGA